jgi:O-antigen/teichoic acid export membrane protein
VADRTTRVPGVAGPGVEEPGVEERSGGVMEERVRRSRHPRDGGHGDGWGRGRGDDRGPGDGWGRGRGDDRGPGDGLETRPFLNSLTDTIDLSGLRRRLALEDLDDLGRIDFGPRLYGYSRSGAGEADSTQVLSRPAHPPGPPAHPPAAPAEVGPQRRRAYDEFEPGYHEDDYGLRDLVADDRAGRHRGLGVSASGRSKALWTLLDQIVSSGTNTVIGVVVARSVSSTEFGAFSIAFTLFALFIGFSRATATSVLGIRYADASPRLFRSAGAAAAGTGLVVGVVTGLGVLLVGGAVGGVVGEALAAIGILFPGLLLQDAWRYVFFAEGRPAAAAANDALWALVQLGAVFLLVTRDVSSASAMLLAWGGAAAVAALLGIAQAGFWPAPERAGEWLSEHREICGYLSLEYVTVQGMQQASTLLIGALAAIEVVGALRGVQILLGPTTVLAVGVVSFAIPEFSRRRDMSPAARLRAANLLSAVVAGAGVTWGLLFLALPAAVGRGLLGDTWDGAQDILALTILQQAGAAAAIGPSCMLYALGRAKLTFRTNLVLSPQLVVWPIIGLQLAGARGAVIGYVVAFWSAVPVWFLTLRRAVREHAAEHSGDDGSAMDAAGLGTVAANEPDPPPARGRRVGLRRSRPG